MGVFEHPEHRWIDATGTHIYVKYKYMLTKISFVCVNMRNILYTLYSVIKRSGIYFVYICHQSSQLKTSQWPLSSKCTTRCC